MAQTLKFGNGTWATKKGSTLAYNDEDGNFKPLPFTYTGAGKGTRVNKDGLIETVGSGEPRIDFKDNTKGSLKLEPSRSNNIAYSQDLTNAAWTKTRVDITSENILNPRGVNSSFKITSNNTSESFIQQAPSSVTGSNQTFSFFIKKGNTNFCHITLFDGGSNGFRQWVNLSNFTLGTNTSFGTGFTLNNSNIEKYSNGWYRVSIVTNNSGATVFSRINISDTDGGNGSSVGSYLYADMVQFEPNSIYATSYIPTQGTIQTRVQETASGSGNSEVFNDSQGILYANIGSFVGADNYRQITISDGSINNYILIGLRNDTGNIYFDSPFSSTFLTDVKPINSFAKCAFKYKVNDFSFWLNGFKVGVDTTTSVPVGLDTLNFDIIGVNDFYGKTKEIAYYDEILTDLELETLTSYRTWEEMVKELNLNIIHNE
jgi:hypothetical protein